MTNFNTPRKSARRRFAPTKRAMMGFKRTPGSKSRQTRRGAKRKMGY